MDNIAFFVLLNDKKNCISYNSNRVCVYYERFFKTLSNESNLSLFVM